MVTASRRLALENQPVELRVSVAQTRNGQDQTLGEISRMAMLFGGGFLLFRQYLLCFQRNPRLGR